VNSLDGFEGSAIFIPGPVLLNTIITSNTKNPFELIPIISCTARSFDEEHKLKATAVTHVDDRSAWLYDVKVGLVPKTRYSVNPNKTMIAIFCDNQHLQCITSNVMAATSTTADMVSSCVVQYSTVEDQKLFYSVHKQSNLNARLFI
jgi:hypothetical protein